MANTSLLDNLESKAPEHQFNVDDIKYAAPQGLTPEQEQAYQQTQLVNQPTRGALSTESYYPGLHHNIGVGNYSGSQIGSTTLFAPGGAIVPLGMMDARDVAVQNAALRKAKEVDDFKKQWNAPTSKLVNINEGLTEGYKNHVSQSWNDALKQTGGDQNKAAYLLKNDPNFQARDKSWHDMAKYGDNLAETKVQNDELRKTGKFVPDKNFIELENNVLKAHNPQDPNFHKFGDMYRAYKQDSNFATVANEVMKDAQKQTLAKAGIDNSHPDYLATRESSVTGYTPEAIKTAAKTVFDQHPMHNPDGSEMTLDQTEKRMQDMFGAQQEKKNVTASQKRAPGEGESDYSSAIPVSSTKFNVASKEGEAPGEIHSIKSYKTSADDEKKQISISIDKDAIDTRGMKINAESGQLKGNVSEAFTGYYNKAEKRFLDPKEVQALQEGKTRVTHDIIAKPAVMFTIAKEKDDTGPANGIIVDVNKIKGKFPKKGASKAGFDDKITELEQDAEAENAKRKGTGWPSQNVKSGTATPAATPVVNIEAKRKKYGY